MVDKALLWYKARQKGKTQSALIEFIGISAPSYYRKCEGKSDFTRQEIQLITQFLELSPDEVMRIFFSPEACKNA